MTPTTRVLFLVAVLVLAGCASSAGATAPPAPSAGSSPAASAPAGEAVTTPEQAAAAVIALDPRFANAVPKDPDVIGGCCFYEATETADGFRVDIQLGWGDCPSGCINHHEWSYTVARDGTTKLVTESGDPVPAQLPAGGGSGDY